MNRGAKGPSMCISSQVGCAVRCIFCATGKDGLMRNLTVDEVAGQVHRILANLETLPSAFDVSFMGMGEPLHNLSAVKTAIEELRAAYSSRCDVTSASRQSASPENSTTLPTSRHPSPCRYHYMAQLTRSERCSSQPRAILLLKRCLPLFAITLISRRISSTSTTYYSTVSTTR